MPLTANYLRTHPFADPNAGNPVVVSLPTQYQYRPDIDGLSVGTHPAAVNPLTNIATIGMSAGSRFDLYITDANGDKVAMSYYLTAGIAAGGDPWGQVAPADTVASGMYWRKGQ